MGHVFVQGYDPKDSSLKPLEQSVRAYKAGGTIGPGSVVVLDVSDATGNTVIASTLALAAYGIAVGVYNGEGGSGAEATVSGTTGKSAASGDIINVVRAGIVSVLCYAQTVANYATAGIMRLMPGTTAGTLTEAAAATDKDAVLWAAKTIVTTGATVAVTARIAFRN